MHLNSNKINTMNNPINYAVSQDLNKGYTNMIKTSKYQSQNKYEESVSTYSQNSSFTNKNNQSSTSWSMDNSTSHPTEAKYIPNHRNNNNIKPQTPEIIQNNNLNNLYNSLNNYPPPHYPTPIKSQKINSQNNLFNNISSSFDQKNYQLQSLNYLLMVNSPIKDKKTSTTSMEDDYKKKKKTQISFDSLKLNFSSKKNSGESIAHSGEIQVNRSYQIKNKRIQDGVYTDENIGNRTQRVRKQQLKRSSIGLFTPSNYIIGQTKCELMAKKFGVDDFQKIKELGNGKYGRVFLVRQKSTNFICALKLIQKKLVKQQEITQQFIRQLRIQIYLNHPNIIKMFGFFQDSLHIYIILEVATGGQLYHLLKKSQSLPQHKIAYYMRQVCEAVKQIHSLRIIHRDIKPQNIVLHDNVVKLCDFGWSVKQDSKLRTTFCGTPLYVCPQILKGYDYDQKIDIWSLGVMMYEMIAGQNPFKITKQEQLVKIIKEQVKIPSYVHISKQLQSLLYMCLKKIPSQRTDIRQLLEHDFFKKYPDKQAQKIK